MGTVIVQPLKPSCNRFNAEYCTTPQHLVLQTDKSYLPIRRLPYAQCLTARSMHESFISHSYAVRSTSPAVTYKSRQLCNTAISPQSAAGRTVVNAQQHQCGVGRQIFRNN